MTNHLEDLDLPRRNEASFISSLTMSGSSLIVVTEGKDDDPYVYDRIFEIKLEGTSIQHEVVRVQDIDLQSEGIKLGSSGKNPVIALFKSLEARRQLSGDMALDAFYCVFMLDKDLDDYKREMIQNSHIIYTPHYDIESVLYNNVNVVDTMAACVSCDRQTISRNIALTHTNDIAARWIEWCALCYTNEVLRIGSKIGYGSISQLNNPSHEVTDNKLYSERRSILVNAGAERGISEAEVEEKIQEAISIMKTSSFNTIFKGKWYSHIISSVLVKGLASTSYSTHQMDQKLQSQLRTAVNYRILTWSDLDTNVSTALTHLLSQVV